jgi:hypothetical protein
MAVDRGAVGISGAQFPASRLETPKQIDIEGLDV